MSEAYKNAGVDIVAGDEAVERMKPHVKRTFRPEVLTDLGGFGALFALNKDKYDKPVLVSGTDGVGTKLKIAFAMDRHDTIGIDAVAMCVNDVIVQGAEPLFFLDYLACDKIVPEKIEAIVSGISEGCTQAGCALIGGETAEMPGMYAGGEYDIAGFTVGIADQSQIINGSSIKSGDVVLGLASNGLHSNGYSLVRKVLLEQEGLSLQEHVDELGRVLGDELLEPTRIYVKPILNVLEKHTIKGMAHITGGGFINNIPRVLPHGTAVEIELGSWSIPSIFSLIEAKGNISRQDMYTTFNMGIGMVVVVAPEHAEEIAAAFKAEGERVYQIGKVTDGDQTVQLVGGQ